MHTTLRLRSFPHAAMLLAATLSGLFVSSDASADESTGGWRHTVLVYGMGAAIDGTAQIGEVKVPVDVGISEVFENLEFGAMVAWRVENDLWSFTTDATFMGLGASDTTEGGLLRGEMDVDQFTLMGTAGRRLTDNFEFLFGLAYVDLSADVRLSGTAGEVVDLRASRDAAWVDPTVGLRYALPLSDQWRLALRGDIGGFGIGSELMYHLLATVHWRLSDTTGILFGYRVIDFDYEDGHDQGYQHYDLTEQGPLVGISFSF